MAAVSYDTLYFTAPCPHCCQNPHQASWLYCGFVPLGAVLFFSLQPLCSHHTCSCHHRLHPLLLFLPLKYEFYVAIIVHLCLQSHFFSLSMTMSPIFWYSASFSYYSVFHLLIFKLSSPVCVMTSVLYLADYFCIYYFCITPLEIINNLTIIDYFNCLLPFLEHLVSLLVFTCSYTSFTQLQSASAHVLLVSFSSMPSKLRQS